MGQRGWIRVKKGLDIYNYYMHWGGEIVADVLKQAIEYSQEVKHRYGWTEVVVLELARKMIELNGRMWTGDVGTLPDNPWILLDVDEDTVTVYDRHISKDNPQEDEDEELWSGRVETWTLELEDSLNRVRQKWTL